MLFSIKNNVEKINDNIQDSIYDLLDRDERLYDNKKNNWYNYTDEIEHDVVSEHLIESNLYNKLKNTLNSNAFMYDIINEVDENNMFDFEENNDIDNINDIDEDAINELNSKEHRKHLIDLNRIINSKLLLSGIINIRDCINILYELNKQYDKSDLNYYKNKIITNINNFNIDKLLNIIKIIKNEWVKQRDDTKITFFEKILMMDDNSINTLIKKNANKKKIKKDKKKKKYKKLYK